VARSCAGPGRDRAARRRRAPCKGTTRPAHRSGRRAAALDTAPRRPAAPAVACRAVHRAPRSGAGDGRLGRRHPAGPAAGRVGPGGPVGPGGGSASPGGAVGGHTGPGRPGSVQAATARRGPPTTARCFRTARRGEPGAGVCRPPNRRCPGRSSNPARSDQRWKDVFSVAVEDPLDDPSGSPGSAPVVVSKALRGRVEAPGENRERLA
jgi:hypothetical protein